jgi:predicted phosphodiesterase
MTFDMDEEDLSALMGDDPADVVVCGMSHTPFDRMLGDIRIINVGSVGDAPDGRTGSNMPPLVAHATWIESTPTGLFVEQTAVPLRD